MVAVITGATGDIGQQLCHCFAQAGIDVVVCYHTRAALAHTLAQQLVDAYHVRSVTVALDTADEAQVAAAFDYIHSVFGHVDYLINNAAISLIRPLMDTTLSDWQRVFAVNTQGCFLTCRAVLDRMYHTGGSIVNVSSMWATLGASCEVAYSASKAAVEGFSRALADEYADHVRVNAVALGYVDTAMNAHLSSAEVDAFFADNPTMRRLTAQEAARCIFDTAVGTASGTVVRLGW